MKIVGFYSGPQEFYRPPPFAGINILETQIGGRTFFLHHFSSEIRERDSVFSFSGDEDLEEPNVVINSHGTIQVDWMATFPVFYSLEDDIVTTYGGLIKPGPIDDLELEVFKYMGRPLCGRTYSKAVRVLRANECLRFAPRLTLGDGSEPLASYPDDQSVEDEAKVFESLQELILRCSRSGEKLIVPLSGGYDSRLIAVLVKSLGLSEKSEAYTYRIGPTRDSCQEGAVARMVAKVLGIRHNEIVMENFWRERVFWEYLFGDYFQYNGLYYINAVKKIQTIGRSIILSGAIGDAIAGKHEEIGNNWDKLFIRSKDGTSISTSTKRPARFREHVRALIEDDLSSGVPLQEIAVRYKIQQLSFLMSAPMHLGADVVAPFLNRRMFKMICRLSAQRKKKRMWQLAIFEATGVKFEASRLLFLNWASFASFWKISFRHRLSLLSTELKHYRFGLNQFYFSICTFIPIVPLLNCFPLTNKLLLLINIGNPITKIEKLMALKNVKHV
jgi:hypothetical protein